jgi:putative heme-binding domain-containing protein
LSHGDSPAIGETLAKLATSAGPPTLQGAAARALVERGDAANISQLFDAWPRFATSLRRDILAAVLRSPQAAESLVSALENGKVQPSELDRESRDALRRVRSREVKARAERILKDAQPASRAAVLRNYQVATSLSTDAARGEKLFTEHCFACHVFRGRGHRVGPDLSGVAARTKELLLADLFDPSGQVAADFTSYVLTTDEGQVFSGLLVAETDNTVTLRRSEGIEEIVERKRIDELRSTGRSLMPDGFEQLLTPQDAADLIEYLRQAPSARE